MTTAKSFPALPAPKAERRPHKEACHGIERVDDYAWLRADNWQEMFKDPATLDPAIRTHLEAENAYQQALMADTADLQKTLFAEMKGRIKEDDASVPMRDGDFAYGTSYRLGGQHPRFFRTPRNGGEQAILLDGDVEAEGKAYFSIGGVDHSNGHGLLLWGYDDKGSEFYTLNVRDLATGAQLADVVGDTGGSGQWDGNDRGFFYTRLDENHRPSQIHYHRLGEAPDADRLVYEETDPGFFMDVGGTRLNDWIMISISDHETSEYRLLPADRPEAEPILVKARETGVQYDLEEGGDLSLIHI